MPEIAWTFSIENRRREFLVGEGTLTAGEVSDWAMEMRASPVPIPAGISEDTELMVAVAVATTRTEPSAARGQRDPSA